MSANSNEVLGDSGTIYRGISLEPGNMPTPKQQAARRKLIPPPPPWRSFARPAQGASDTSGDESVADCGGKDAEPVPDLRGLGFVATDEAKQLVNAALCLRRPLLIQGKPGSGKTTLAYAVALELGLPGPYRWSITSRTTLEDGLYSYDAIGRLQQASLQGQGTGKTESFEPPDIGKYLRLGPMGMAFHQSQPKRPAVLLIDEIDKSDIDLPNDLLHIFEEGFFEIPELSRLEKECIEVLPHRNSRERGGDKVRIERGIVECKEFPLVFMTSNEAREFPPAFLRRCLPLDLQPPKDVPGFNKILLQRFGTQFSVEDPRAKALVEEYLRRVSESDRTLATDQLLNAVYLLLQGEDLMEQKCEELRNAVYKPL